MTPQLFIAKWRNAELNERAASQSHFNDLCQLLGVEDPITADQKGEWYAFEKGATKTGGGEGWADVWRKGCFAWEYKGKKKDLDKAFAQLQQYAIALENPPLLIVSDMDRFRIHTNWTNTVQQVHEFALDDLANATTRDLLRHTFLDPEQLRPAKTRQMLTEEAAREFASLAQRLRDRGHPAQEVAHFVNRLVFCMFAEDVGLLSEHMFSAMLKASRSQPEDFASHAATLFSAMKSGGLVGFTKVEWFNGGLFDDDSALPLERADIDNLIAAAALDWSEIDPSILGTLFERGLDPGKRSQLGAHYTDREKIMQIVEPVIQRPLASEWAAIRDQIEELIASAPQQTAEKLLRGADRAKRTKALDKAQGLLRSFVERLRTFRVLDPACGSGNFLYLSLLTLKDLEHRANLEAEALGCSREFPAVGPECVLGIELNPYAAELARVSVWIGEIQWMRRNGFEAARNPILRSLGNIECRDAVLDEATGERAVWPEADVIVGNPPFLGAKWMLDRLGEEYTARLRGTLPSGTPAVNLVAYWFYQASLAIASKTSRVGFVATNMIRSPTNVEVASKLYEAAPIKTALSDEEWVVDGAAVRVSLIVCDAACSAPITLDGREVPQISHDLKSLSVDMGKRQTLRENLGRAVRGIEKGGPFQIGDVEARVMLSEPTNPNGLRNHLVIKRYATVSDIVGRGKNEWIIDFFGMDEGTASLFEAPFSHLSLITSKARSGNRETRQMRNWWLFRRSGEQARQIIAGKKRLLTTGLVTKFRVFRWLSPSYLPDTRVVLIDCETDCGFGILSSRFHELWTLSTCQFHGVGNDPVYTPSDVFETFPFPEGLAPDLAAVDYADDPRAQALAAAAARLNELRENWLNPPDLIKRVPEVVPGYPDRILPKDDAAAQVLKKRTLTNLYNQRPAWLDHAHRALDEAVADAYGWGEDFRAGTLTDDEILARLFQLNQERAAR